MPFNLSGSMASTPFCVGGAVPGIIVVTALMMVGVVGPSDTEPPQASTATEVSTIAASIAALKVPEIILRIFGLKFDENREWWA